MRRPGCAAGRDCALRRQLTNYGKTAQVVTVTVPLPANASLADAGPFGRRQCIDLAGILVPGAHLAYVPAATDLPYIDLADYGIPLHLRDAAGR